MQDCSISRSLALKMLQSCTKPLIYPNDQATIPSSDPQDQGCKYKEQWSRSCIIYYHLFDIEIKDNAVGLQSVVPGEPAGTLLSYPRILLWIYIVRANDLFLFSEAHELWAMIIDDTLVVNGCQSKFGITAKTLTLIMHWDRNGILIKLSFLATLQGVILPNYQTTK